MNQDETLDNNILEDTHKMLETYLLKFQDLENDINRFTREMDNTQKILNINLLTQRNYYAILQTYISMVTLSLSFGSFIGSMFGMNLYNKIEDDDHAFFIISSGCLFLILLLSFLQIYFFKTSNTFKTQYYL